MHTFSETGAGVPAFLAKLWRLVEDPETNHLIYWSRDGRSFIIQNQAQFARELLPLNYKHNNMASFIRQLNMYGFHKITSIDNGGLKFDRDEMEFSHPCFKRGCPYLLEHIKRKIATQKTTIDERAGMKPEAVNKVLSEVKIMRGRQDSLDSRFSVMKQENEALWREVASLRQKHMKQQQIVNKLIQFLVTIVQPSRNMSGVKRHFQLMINDAPQSSKVRKRSESESGPIIHELTEELLEEVADTDDAELLISSSPNVLSPGNDDNDYVDEDDISNQIASEIADDPDPMTTTMTTTPRSERPKSTKNISSQQYESNPNEDLKLSGTTIINAKNGSNGIVYHISEVPEHANITVDSQYLEDNVLNTPLVKQEMARKQELQRLKRKNKNTSGQSMKKTRPLKQQVDTTTTLLTAPQIKTETEIDPLMFLDVSPDECNVIDPTLMSPNTNNSSSTAQEQDVRQMYALGDFISTEMPTDLLEDSAMIGDINLASGSYNQNINMKSLAGGKTSTISRGGGSSSGGNDNSETLPNTSTEELQNKNDSNNLRLTKYNNQKFPTDDEIMRLSTPAEFNNHLENVQEDLDNLKDILRGDGYSLDANTLMGLFSDADILSPYGISLSNENIQDNNRKGSELITYQPYYSADLADILDMNNSEDMNKSCDNDSSTKFSEPPSSVLNTPYPERD